MKKIKVSRLTLTFFLVLLMAAPPWILAQNGEEPKTFKQEELDQILAPIALYPDELLSQVLMASTYPLEVVQAERWQKQNKSLKGDALAVALEKQDWDPSVKSLVNFPDVLTMMSEKLDWTQKLGDAFLEQQKEVMGTVQKLRLKAEETGNLKTTSEQKVIVEEETKTIIIEPANPQVVYVPTYNPTVVYGPWWYPSYPPYYYYPPGYVAGAAFVSFGVGVAMGAAWGYAWGGCNWHGGDVDIDIDRNSNINRNIDRSKYKDRAGTGTGQGGRGQGGQGKWQHNPEHRKGVSYRDQGTAQKFNKASTREATQARESFRGRAEQGSRDLSRGGAGQFGGGQGGQQRAGDRAGGNASTRESVQRGGRDSAFGGGQSGSQTRQQSSRGSSSRQSMSSSGGGGSEVGRWQPRWWRWWSRRWWWRRRPQIIRYHRCS